MADEALLELTADIVASHLTNNNVALSDVPELIKNVHFALKGLGQSAPEPIEEQKPAVSVRASIKPDHLVSLESGRKMTMLKRYLMTNYAMTPDDYRKKWGLPADYPMVAPAYADKRRDLAKAIGLGQKKPAPAPAPTPKPRRSKKLALSFAAGEDASASTPAPASAPAKTRRSKKLT